MMNRFKPFPASLLCAVITLAGAALSSAQSDAQSKLDALFGNEVIARGEGFEIKRSTLDKSVVTIRSSAAARGGNISPQAIGRLEREVLRRLINIALLTQLATDEDRAKGQAEAETRIEYLRDRAGSEEAMLRQLKASGLTLDELRSRLIEEATGEAVLRRELNVEITDEQVQEFYDENPARFEKPEMVRAAHILLRTQDPFTNQELSAEVREEKLHRIESLLRRAREGADFAELAVEYSEDTASRDRGGEYTFPRGKMPPAFEAAAFSLAPGQVSDVITTGLGYHIVKVYEKIPATTVALDDAVKAEVRKFLENQEIQKQMEPFMQRLMKEKNVEILDEGLKPQPGDTPTRSDQ